MMGKMISHLGRGDTQEIHILPAGVRLTVKVHGALWFIEKELNHYHIVVYEENRLSNGQWMGTVNALADTPAKVSKGKCDFCGKPMPPSDQLAAQCWIPSYWSPEDNEEILEPVCGYCLPLHLVYNEEIGDFEKRPKSSRANQPDDTPSAYLNLV
jgi:hypothetical protein